MKNRDIEKVLYIMNQIQKLKLNSTISLLARIVIIFSGLILPRLIIANYGAETHGLVNSIAQFLGVITFLDMGVGVVVQSALYRPLVENNTKQISSILIAAKKYFRKIAYVLIAYVLGLIIFYPLIIETTKSHLSVVFLILAMFISQFGLYYFGIVNEKLLSANQQDYIQLGSEIIVVILNLIVSVFLINLGVSIEVVKLGSGLIYLIRPVYLSIYIKKNFDIDYDIEIEDDPLPQKWNGVGQHIAYSINNSADVIVLTLFSSLESVSVYSIYNMVISAVKMVVTSLSTGIQSFFGNLYASDQLDSLNNYFDRIEWIIHTSVIYLFGMSALLIDSFVMLYTAGVENISYEAPLFSLIFVLAGAIYSIRTPYNSIVLSAGHFRETQRSSFIEAGLNIIISTILVSRFGLVGIAIGTFIAMAYRTLYLVVYLSQNILLRPVKKFIKHLIVDIVSFSSIMIVGMLVAQVYTIATIIEWVIVAMILGVINLVFIFLINLIFYKKMLLSTINSIFKKS